MTQIGNRNFRRIECLGIVGRFPTPEGLQTLYDTGRKVSAVEVAEAITLQHSYFGKVGDQKETGQQAYDFANRIVKKLNVYPKGFVMLADDGRILVTEPWFEEEIV